MEKFIKDVEFNLINRKMINKVVSINEKEFNDLESHLKEIKKPLESIWKNHNEIFKCDLSDGSVCYITLDQYHRIQSNI